MGQGSDAGFDSPNKQRTSGSPALGSGVRIPHKIVTSYAHHEIHEGNGYGLNTSGTKNADAYIAIELTTPNTATHLHMITAIYASGAATYSIGEAATTTGGSAATIYNRNRNSANTSAATTPKDGITVSDIGTEIFTTSIGAGQQEGGTDRDINEWVLKANTKYAFRLTSNAASNVLRLNLEWYESDDYS